MSYLTLKKKKVMILLTTIRAMNQQIPLSLFPFPTDICGELSLL